MRALIVCLLGFAPVARAADAELETIRALLLPMRSDQTAGRIARGATPAFTEVKHQLRDWIESRIAGIHWTNSVRWNPAPEVLQEQLNDELARASLLCEHSSTIPCPDWTLLGFLGRIAIEIDKGTLIVRTGVGIDQCGHDESAYAYELTAGGSWHRFWASEQNDYADGKYFPQQFRSVMISGQDFSRGADKFERLILTLGTQPWCSSAWHDVYSRVWQTKTSYTEPRLILDEKTWAWVVDPIQGRVNRTEVLFEYSVPSLEGGFVRPEIRHYILHGERLERGDPVALTPRQFTAFWLGSSPPAPSEWSEQSGTANLNAWRAENRGPFWEFTHPTQHCSLHPDLWQVGTDEGDDGKRQAFFLVRWRPPYHFTMVAARDRPWPDCSEPDRGADEPSSLFPFQMR